MRRLGFALLGAVLLAGSAAVRAKASTTPAVPVRSDIRLGNGRNLSFLHWVNAGKPVMLLLHGKQGFASSFVDIAARYGDRFDLYAIDMRGRGFSDWAPDGDYTVESTERDIVEFVSAQGLRRFAIYGHSFGAVMGLNYAAHHPQQVSFLVMEDAGPTDLPDGRQPRLNERQEAPAGAEVPEPAPKTFARWDEAVASCRKRCSPLEYESLFVRRHDGTVAERSDIRGLWASKRGEGFLRQWPLVRAVAVPALVLRAQYGLLPRQIAEEMQRLNPRFSVIHVAGADHGLRASQPETAFRAIDAFLGWADVGARMTAR